MNDGEVFFNELLRDFEVHGVAAIERVREENPLEYLKLCAALVEQDIRISLDTSDAVGMNGER